MYYHCRPLKYVEYGKVFPPPVNTLDEYFVKCYKWLGYYCKFYPQVWLSRGNLSLTGFKREFKKEQEVILFGFENIVGFPVSFEPWEYIMNTLMNDKSDDIAKINKQIAKDFEDLRRDSIAEKWEPDMDLKGWIDCGRDVNAYFKKHLFVEKDQVVVPSLNLKTAKQVICRNERQKKILRHMGFIEDRIVIKNFKTSRW